MNVFWRPREPKLGLDCPDGRRALVLYVWDNEFQRVASLHRAVSRRAYKHKTSGGMIAPAFDIGEIGAFVGRLKNAYPESRYAIRDWLAGSMLDFFQTRYAWTEDDFRKYRPEGLLDPFEAGGASAPPPLLCDYSLWLPSNRESESRTLGHKSGLPLDEQLYKDSVVKYIELRDLEHLANMRLQGVGATNDSELTAYLADRERHGFSAYMTADDIPDGLCVVTARLRVEARWALSYLLAHVAEPCLLMVPREEREMRTALYGRYDPSIVLVNEEPMSHFFCLGRIEDGRRRLFVVRHHKMTCRENFLPELIHEPDA